jgi:hypothetical protein
MSMLRKSLHVKDKISKVYCISQKGVLHVELSENIILCTDFYLRSISPGSVNTRDTREWGRGIGRVAEGLPIPIPAHTLPATRAGLPHPCHCLAISREIFGVYASWPRASKDMQ